MIQGEYGIEYTIGDWTDLQAIADIEAWITCLGIPENQTFMLTRNGEYFYYGNRQYMVHYSSDGIPYPNYLVHDQIGPLYLGSWYGLNQQVLALNEGGSIMDFSSINDVPNDQGRQVQTVWYKSILDKTYSPDNFYTLWRLDEIFGENTIELAHPSEILKKENTQGKHFVWFRDGEVWSYINTIPAVMQEQYSVIAPTLMDSCASGMNYSTFKVFFHNATAFYESEADSGYSVDNLAPQVPQDFKGYAADNTIQLNWSEPVDEDFRYFAIYKTDESGQFAEEPFVTTITNEITDIINSEDHNYKVSAFDFNGNQSMASEVITAQSILINSGWTGVSSYVIPSYPSIENVMDIISDELVILQNMAGVYWPGENINTLGDWNVNSGYFMKTTADVNLPVVGLKQQNTLLYLNVGWSLIPVLSDCPVEVSELFNNLNVAIIKEVAGYNIFWPAMGINTLGQLQPGKAYFVLMDGEGEIEFPECAPNTDQIAGKNRDLTGLGDLLGLTPTPITHIIAIPVFTGNEIGARTILSAFDVNGNCFGATGWQGGSTAITLFGDDPTTVAKDGFVEGEPIFFKANNPVTGEVFTCEVEYDISRPNHDGSFVSNGLSIISGFKLEELGIDGDLANSILIYPHPAKDEIFVQMDFQGNIHLEIVDQLGNNVLTQNVSSENSRIDVSSLSIGVYLIKIKGVDISIVKKLVIK